MRPIEDWADRVYAPGTAVAHTKPFGEDYALCGLNAEQWFGTGSFDEIEHAARLPLCEGCQQTVRNVEKPRPPHNEFTAPAPLYRHQEIPA